MALTFPSSPTNGQVYTDTATGNRYTYDSTRGLWKITANTVAMSVSSTPPANVATGSLWFNREIGRTFVYYDDGDSIQWIETVPSGSIDTNTIAAYTGPIYASLNSCWTSTNTSYTFANLAITTANTAFPNTPNVSYNGSFYVPNGAISIGTNSYPTGKFQVVTANGEISRLTATGASGGYEVFYFDNSTPWYLGSAKATIAGNINDLYLGSGYGTTNNLIFGSAAVERMRIDPTGNVIIPNVITTGNVVTNRANVDIINPRTSGGGVYIPGHVIQVVSATDGSYNAISLASGATTNWISATISRKIPNSKILIMFSGNYSQSSGSDSGLKIYSSLDGTLTSAAGNSATNGAMRSIVSIGTDHGSVNAYYMENASFHHLHTPSGNTTAAITFTIQIYLSNADAATTVYPNGDGWRGSGEQSHNTLANLTLLEIAV